MPGQMCCDIADSINKLVDGATDDKVKTTGYLTLEVLYASRRLFEFGDHIDSLMRHLLANPEMPDITAAGNQSLQSNQRIIAYI